jgi:hypothetical protein
MRALATITASFVTALGARTALAQTAPIIVEDPKSVIVAYGGAASFSVTAEGTPPFSYRWRSNGFSVATNITGVYWVSNATTIARYDVVVTNPYGGRLSGRGTLNIFSYERTENGLDLTLSGYSVSGTNTYAFEIEHKQDLANTNWTVFTNLVLPQSTVRFETWSFTNAPQGFFRVVMREQ